MKELRAIIDGLVVKINATETSEEYRAGARLLGEHLGESEGFLFEYDCPRVLGFENTAVPYDLRVLYLQVVGSDDEVRQGVVLECLDMEKDSAKIVQPTSPYSMAIELRKDFCEKNRIGSGSIVTLYNSEDLYE